MSRNRENGGINRLSAEEHINRMQNMHKEDIKYVEMELSFREIVSLSFLIFGDDSANRSYILQKLFVSSKSQTSDYGEILQHFANIRDNWKHPVLEALSIIKANKVLRKWGFDVNDLKDIYLPHIAEISCHINPVLKALYFLCENLKLSEGNELISAMSKNYDETNRLTTHNPLFLEISLLDWISKSFLTVGKWDKKVATSESNLDLIIQFLKEHDFITLKEMITTCVQSFNSSIVIKPRNITTDKSNSSGTEMISRNMEQREDDIQQDDDCYKIAKDSAGFILIINQETFTRETDPTLEHLLPEAELNVRTGTNKDKDALASTFRSFGYMPIVIENKDHRFVKETILEIVKRSVAYHSLIVCILSHGIEGAVYGSNSIPIQIKSIKEMMTTDDALLNKPKMLIIQACQGADLQIARYVDELEFDGPNRGAAAFCDMLVFQSTVNGFASIRHKEEGTWFIQSLCKHVNELGDRKHMEDIFTSVISDVSSKRGGENVCMVPEKSTTLRHRLYLPKRN